MTFRGKTTVLLLLVCSTAWLLPGCSRAIAQPEPLRPQPVTQDGMTLDWSQSVKAQALKMIEGSVKVCDFDIYELSDGDVLNALEAAHQRGVDVRVIVDDTEKHSQDTAVPFLKQHGIPVVSQHITHGISHIKMLITDGSNGGVLIGGMNFGTASWNNNDASVYLSRPSGDFETLFRWDWLRANGQPAAAPHIRLPLVIDSAIQEPVLQAIQNAKHSISLEAFDLSDKDVVSALVSAARRGLMVEVLLDPGQYYNQTAASKLRDAGVTVRFYRPYDGELMHAKILDVDGGSTFIIGSANFSHQAYTYNHEGDIVLHNVSQFDHSLQQDLSIQIARGTDYPVKTSHQGE